MARVKVKYVAVGYPVVYNCEQSDWGVYTAISDSPVGPFTAWQKVFDLTEYEYGKRARLYAVHIHPQAVNDHDELLITYSGNFYSKGDVDCYVVPPNNAPDSYFTRVHAVRIPYSLIGLSALPVAQLDKKTADRDITLPVVAPELEAHAVSVVYRDMLGRDIAKPASGLYLEVTLWDDGRRTTRKIYQE